MSVAGYNERKLSVLMAVEGLEEARAMDVAEETGISYVNARKALSRYHYQGLLDRRKGVYTINEKGRERLEYLTQDDS
jgi:predicted transcriptional regulator of viral defense system